MLGLQCFWVESRLTVGSAMARGCFSNLVHCRGFDVEGVGSLPPDSQPWMLSSRCKRSSRVGPDKLLARKRWTTRATYLKLAFRARFFWVCHGQHMYIYILYVLYIYIHFIIYTVHIIGSPSKEPRLWTGRPMAVPAHMRSWNGAPSLRGCIGLGLNIKISKIYTKLKKHKKDIKKDI